MAGRKHHQALNVTARRETFTQPRHHGVQTLQLGYSEPPVGGAEGNDHPGILRPALVAWRG